MILDLSIDLHYKQQNYTQVIRLCKQVCGDVH